MASGIVLNKWILQAIMFSWLKKSSPLPENAGQAPIGGTPGEELAGKAGPLEESNACKKQGNEFLAQGLLEEAAECYRQAIAFDPDHAEAYLNLGFVLHGQELYKEAETYLEQASHLNPRMADAYYLLGTIAQELGNLDRAIEYFNKALEVKPDFEIVYRDLCQCLLQDGQNEAARNILEKGISFFPDSADLHYFLGNLFVSEKDTAKAIACYQKALLIQPDYAVVYSNMGKAYLELGDIDNAVECYQKVLSLDPEDIQAESCLLFIQSFNEKCSPTQYLLEAKAFGSKVMAHAKPYTRWHYPTGSNPQPLRVGLVSGDFRTHPVGFFLEGILSHLPPTQIELVAFPTQPQEDELTARIKPRFSAWKSIAGLSDTSAAQKIHAEGIHILIDLAGHTSHNRLPVFAWKPAPVQVSWLGYLASTGLPGMDFLLADRVSVPESHREHFSEDIWYLPDTVNCLTPPATSARLAITPPPALHNGYITFGCFQNLTKINDEVLALWAQIFHALPQARLRFHSKQMSSQNAREQLQLRLGCFGISPERVDIEGVIPSREGFLATYAEVDIILDSFPYPGITTTCEALWMGVPTLTLAGETMLARQGASLLTCAGLEEWVARNKEEYVTLALAYAADVNRLAQLRAGLRQQVLVSPLFNAPLFAKRFEDALQGMWLQFRQKNLSDYHV